MLRFAQFVTAARFGSLVVAFIFGSIVADGLDRLALAGFTQVQVVRKGGGE